MTTPKKRTATRKRKKAAATAAPVGRYALVRDADGRVMNITEWDGTSAFSPPEGQSVIPATATAQIGDTWDGSAFVPDTTPLPPDPLAQEKQRVRAFVTNAEVEALIAADPASLNVTQRIARGQAIAFIALVKIVRSELME